MNTIHLNIVIALFFLLNSTFALALSQYKQLSAHKHGVAELQIAMESQIIQIHLTSPATDIIGFEHKAKAEVEIQRVKQAEEILKNTSALFKFTGAQCSVQEKKVDLSAIYWNRDHTGHGHRHQHTEVNAYYEFLCSRQTTAVTITIGLFSSFPSLHKIRALWLTEDNHGSMTLTPKINAVPLP